MASTDSSLASRRRSAQRYGTGNARRLAAWIASGCLVVTLGTLPLLAQPVDDSRQVANAPSQAPTNRRPLAYPNTAGGQALSNPAESERQLKPILSPEILATRAQAQAVFLQQHLLEDAQGQSSIDPALGRFTPVENEPALTYFHEALRRLVAGKEPDGKVRIAAYGASHTQGGYYTGYLREYLQRRFGNGGAGFLPMGRINKYYRNPHYHVWGRGLRSQYVRPGSYPRHGRFGLLGAAFLAELEEDYGRVQPRDKKDPSQQADRFELFYWAEPGGSDLLFSMNWKPKRLSGSSSKPEARYELVQMPKLGWHQAQVQPVAEGRNPVRVFGIAVERSTPGVVVDTLGINGARAANMLRWNKALWQEHLKRRDPELFLLAYGTNETVDVKEPIADYEKNLREVLTRFREALPNASCLLVGPGDFPKMRRGKWRTQPRLLDVIAIQRRVAPDFSCGFWDSFQFMGGEGSMVKWVKNRPQLAARDHIHFTPRGYVKKGMALGDALMRRYDADPVGQPSAHPSAQPSPRKAPLILELPASGL